MIDPGERAAVKKAISTMRPPQPWEEITNIAGEIATRAINALDDYRRNRITPKGIEKEKKSMKNLRLYKKLPMEYEAIQWTGHNLAIIFTMINKHPSAERWTWEQYTDVVKRNGLKIFTPRGAVMAHISDWIVKDQMGNCFPVDPVTFEATYQAAKS